MVETKEELQDCGEGCGWGRERPVEEEGGCGGRNGRRRRRRVSRDRVKLGHLGCGVGAWWREITEGGENLLRGGEEECRGGEENRRTRKRKKGGLGEGKKGGERRKRRYEEEERWQREEGRLENGHQPKWCEMEKSWRVGWWKAWKVWKEKKGGGIPNTPGQSGIMDRESYEVRITEDGKHPFVSADRIKTIHRLQR